MFDYKQRPPSKKFSKGFDNVKWEDTDSGKNSDVQKERKNAKEKEKPR